MLAGGLDLRPDQVGHKLSRLSRLGAAGLPVPPFFCLPVDSFREVLAPLREEVERERAGLDLADPASARAVSRRIRALFLRARISPDLEAAIMTEYDIAFGPAALAAVRASVIGSVSEDSALDAFAGMSDSFLYVPRGDLMDRVRRCWASGFNAESLLYRHARGMDPFQVEVAVGVQLMVLGERSFVMFTCDPRTGAPDTVVAAAYGIGEGVVQERVGIDHYFLRGGELESRVADKPERLGLDPARPEAGPVPLPVAEERRRRPVLDREEIRALAEVGARVERLFECPQDIEGTFSADGAVHLVQARPIVLDLSLRRQWSCANVTESFPGVTTALTYTFAQRFYAAIFADLYRRLGVDGRTLRRSQVHLDRMIGLHHGRVYYELEAWYRLHSQLALFPLFRASWEGMMGLAQTPGTPNARRPSWFRLAGALARVAYLQVVHDAAMARFETWWESVVGPLRGREWDDADPLARIQELQDLWAAAGERWGVTLINDSALSSTAGIAERLLRRWAPGEDGGLLSDLLCGDEDNRSVAILLSLVRLAEQARARPDLMAALAAEPACEVWRRLERGEFGTQLRDQVREHLHRWGDRGLQELKMEQLNLRQDPSELLRLVDSYARTGIAGDELRERERRIRGLAEARLAKALRGHPLRRLLLGVVLGRLRRCVRYRENSRYCRSELFGVAKAIFHSLGRDLAARRVLRNAGEVVHLTQDELCGAFDGTGATEDLRGLADVRRTEFEAPGPQLPMRFTTLGPVRDGRPDGPDRPPAEPGALQGLGSSGGTARGIARVVLDPTDHADLGEAVILVARETDPGWLFLMLRAAGIVVERGTMLSHTAITGRKFGIPTIVSLPGATEVIPDGAEVEMDGASGLVRVLGRESA
jgi:pyruvate,water dikinase